MIAVMAANEVLNGADVDSAEFRARVPTSDDFCSMYSDEISQLLLESDSYLAIGWLCGKLLTEEDLCSVVTQWTQDSLAVKPPAWTASGFPTMYEIVETIADDSCKQAIYLYLIGSVYRRWLTQSSGHGMKLFGRSLRGVDHFCEPERLERYAQWKKALAFSAYSQYENRLCGSANPTLVCSMMYPGFTTDWIVADYHGKGVSLAELSDELRSAGYMGLVDRVPADCKPTLVRYIVQNYHDVKTMYGLSVQGVEEILSTEDEVAMFCQFNQQLLRDVEFESALNTLLSLCPDLPLSRQQLASLARSLARQPQSHVIEITRDQAFSDSLVVLTNEFADVGIPQKVVFINEPWTADSQVADWIQAVAKVVMEVDSPDEAGGLFVANGFDEQKPETLFYAFGRLMAIAVNRHVTLNVDIPEKFFEEFFAYNIEGLPVFKRDLMAKVKDGFEYFYSIESFSDVLSPGNMRTLITGIEPNRR